MQKLDIDKEYLIATLQSLLAIPSPSGYTDQVVHHVGTLLEELSIPFEITRRGAIRATLRGKAEAPCRAIVAHIDTLGAMVRELKDNGRLGVAMVGTWSARFAEGARVTIFTDGVDYRGTILPLKASGHVYNVEIDTQPVGWDYVEIRVDERTSSAADLAALGIRVGDFVAIDAKPEFVGDFVVSRHLDNKAGVAVLLAALQAVLEAGVRIPLTVHPLFTIFEEVGTGASGVLHRDVAEMLSIDNATPAPGQNSTEFDVILAMMDSSGPFDYHLTRKIGRMCTEWGIPHRRDIFRYYRCDAASAIDAGNDIRTALACFGVDGSHGYERTHLDSLMALAQTVALYMQSDATFKRDRNVVGPLRGFPEQPMSVPVHDAPESQQSATRPPASEG